MTFGLSMIIGISEMSNVYDFGFLIKKMYIFKN